MITIKISTDNDAFSECNGTEIAWVLRELALSLNETEVGPAIQTLRDTNGNICGKMTITK